MPRPSGRPVPARTSVEPGTLRALRAEPDPDRRREGLGALLRSGHGAQVAGAAELAADRGITELRPALLAAWDRLYVEAERLDPTCAGKAGCALALHALDHPDRAPFVRGATHIQMQPMWPRPEDVAPPLRAACVHALATFGGVEALLVIAVALADPHEAVRAAAARGLAFAGEPAAAAMALQLLRSPEPDHGVIADALAAFASLRPREAAAEAERVLSTASEPREVAVLLALGQARVDSLFPLLDRRVAPDNRPDVRRAAIVALGLSRSTEARNRLLGLVREAALRDATDAIAALASLSQSAALRAEVAGVAAGRGLESAIEAAFG